MCWSSKALNCLQPDKEVNFVLKCYFLFDIFFSSSKTSLSLHKTDKILLPFHSIGKFGRRIVAIGNCCSSLWNFQEIVWIIEISQRPFKMSLQHFNSHLQAVFGNVKVFHSLGKFGRRIVAVGNCCSSLWVFQEIVWIIEISQRPFKMSLQHFNSHLQAVFGNVKVALHDQSQTCKLIVLLEILNMRVHSWWICSFFFPICPTDFFWMDRILSIFFSIGELLVQVVFDT